MSPKDNLCVVCGSIDRLTMHHCVPWLFRRGFPDQYKKSASHDVLPLCTTCHEAYELEAEKLKRRLSIEHNLPIYPPHRRDKTLTKVRSLAQALNQHKHQIPPRRVVEMTKFLSDYLGRPATETDIPILAEVNTDSQVFLEWEERASMLMHGMTVAELRAFAKMWREHFLSCMKPRFMHKNWDIDHWKKEWIEKYGE